MIHWIIELHQLLVWLSALLDPPAEVWLVWVGARRGCERTPPKLLPGGRNNLFSNLLLLLFNCRDDQLLVDHRHYSKLNYVAASPLQSNLLFNCEQTLGRNPSSEEPPCLFLTQNQNSPPGHQCSYVSTYETHFQLLFQTRSIVYVIIYLLILVILLLLGTSKQTSIFRK